MMRRLLACIVAIACLLTAFATFALADGEIIGSMKVIKCKQAVNLRKGPSTDTPSLGLVPLGTVLDGCAKVDGSEWIAVNYQGQAGYIRGDFLELIPAELQPEPALMPEPEAPAEEAEVEVFVPSAEAPVESINQATDYNDDFVILDQTLGDVRVIARQIFQIDNEYLMIVGLDANGNELWKKETNTGDVSELTQTDAFIGGTEAAPLVMMYNDWVGLSALDPRTGEVRWEVLKQQIFLGGSISRAVDANGVLYIGGYYGPDPVAIDANGNVLWQSSSGDLKANWMYAIELQEDGVCTRYSSMAGDKSGAVIYDYNGTTKAVIYD